MYTVRFQLELSGSEKRFLSKSFFYANQMHNQLVRYATNRLNALFHDKEYVGARKAYGEAEFSKKKGSEQSASEKKKKKELSNIMCIKQKEYNLTKTSLCKFVSKEQKKFKNYINSHQAQAEAREINRLAQQKLENMDLPSIPEPEIQVNRFTKKEYAKLSVDEFDKIKQVIEHQQTQITSLEAQKSDLSAKLENVELKLDTARKKPYMRENERLSAELEKNKSKIDKFDEISVQNQQLKEQINNLKLDLEKEKQRSENFKIIGKLYQCMYLHLMNHIIPSVIQKFKIVELIRNGLDNLFTGVLDEYQNKSKNPDIYTQLFDDNTDLNNSYPNIDQEFANLPDVDELIEISELDREKDYDHCR